MGTGQDQASRGSCGTRPVHVGQEATEQGAPAAPTSPLPQSQLRQTKEQVGN